MAISRPKYSPLIARAAAETIVSELISGGHLRSDERDVSVLDIAKHCNAHEDGYGNAKRLDDNAHWDCDFQMAEILDGYASCIGDEIRKAEKQWVEMTSPQPPFPIGARVRVNANEVGEITGIYEYGAAKYLVKIDGDLRAIGEHGSRRVVNFEDVSLEAQAA